MTDNTTPQPVSDADREANYGEIIWNASRRDEGTISFIGANHVARAVMALADAEIEAKTASLRAENERLRQGLWGTWVALGHDTDGDTGPCALIAGMGVDGFIGVVVRDAATWRKESEDDYDADTSRLEAALAEERAKVARVHGAASDARP